jgi:hypothetical protein
MYAKKRPLPLCVYSESQTLSWWLGGKENRKQNTFGPVETTGRWVSPALPNLLCSNSLNIQAVVFYLHPTYIADIWRRFEAKSINLKTCLLHDLTCGRLQKAMT